MVFLTVKLSQTVEASPFDTSEDFLTDVNDTGEANFIDIVDTGVALKLMNNSMNIRNKFKSFLGMFIETRRNTFYKKTRGEKSYDTVPLIRE
jgi:hypothetical protein